jgi:hypothetical protein
MKKTSASPADTLSPLGDAVLVSDAAETAADERNLVVLRDPDELPPILAGHQTPKLRARAQSFYAGVAEMFERWAARRPSHHTQRAYRRDVLSFVDFLGLIWPQQAFKLLLASVADVQRWRGRHDGAATKAPKTLNRRISSLSSFYKYLAAAAELRLRQPPQSGARPIHRPGIVRSAGRHAGAYRHPRPSADGPSRRRRRTRFPATAPF